VAVPVSLIINVDIPDIEKGIAFYRDGLGFTLHRMLFDGTVAEMKGAGCLVYLLPHAGGTIAVPYSGIARDYSPHWTPVHLDLAIPDLELAINRALAAGATRSGPQTSQPYGKLALMRDPFGHGFCLIQFNDQGYDAVA
jgi:predicted enzyme related to lactoylglutathione lyase